MSPGNVIGVTVRRLRRVGPLAVASIASTVNTLLVTFAYARLGGAAPFGTYQLAIAVGAIGAIGAFVGSGTASTRAAAQGRNAAWPLFRARLPRCLLVGAGMVVAGLVMAEVGDHDLGLALIAMGATFPAAIGADVFPGHLLGAQRYREYGRFQVALQGSMAVAVIVAVAVAPGSPWLATLAWGAVVGGWQLGGLLRLRVRAALHEEDRAYARSLSKIFVLSAVDARADVLLTGALLSPAGAGLLAVARTLPLHLKSLWEVLAQPIFARLVPLAPAEALAFCSRYRWQLVAVLGLPAILAAALAPLLVPVVFGQEFRGSVLPAQLMLLGNVVLAVGSMEAVMLRAQGFIDQLTVVHATLPTLTIVLLPPLLLTVGVAGAGAKVLVVSAVYAGLAIVLARRATRARRADARPEPALP